MISKKNRLIVYIMTIAMVILSGCGSAVALTEEQNDLVAEYAAGLLVKYNNGHTMGLVSDKSLDMELLYATATPTPIPTPEPVEEILPEEEVSEDGLVDDISSGGDDSGSNNVAISLVPLNEAFGLNGAQLTYVFYELCDTYPTMGDDLVMSMNASPGNQLLIVHMNLVNPTADTASFATNLAGKKVRALINGQDKIRADVTLLSNDLINYSGTLESMSGEDVVLVFDVPVGTNIGSLDLLILDGRETMRYNMF